MNLSFLSEPQRERSNPSGNFLVPLENLTCFCDSFRQTGPGTVSGRRNLRGAGGYASQDSANSNEVPFFYEKFPHLLLENFPRSVVPPKHKTQGKN